MYYASSISKRLALVYILVVVATQLFLMRNVSSLNMTNAYVHHKCLTHYGKYKSGSQYEKYLNKIIDGFLHNRDDYDGGYALVGLGDQPDHVSVTLQCRGDSYGPKCRSCFAKAQYELIKRCPKDKGRIIWYDQCLVEFSPIYPFGKISFDEGVCISRAKNSNDNFVSKFLTLFNNLTNIILTKNRIDFYAAGEKRFQEKKMYVMVQCLTDISLEDCEACLSYSIKRFRKCYHNTQGARIFLGKNCNFRFELYPFINSKTSPNYYKF